MPIGHLRASRLDHDNVLPSKDPVGLIPLQLLVQGECGKAR